ALGIVESFSVASLIEAADAAVKAANVQLIEIRLAMALGGKAFVTLTGNVASVQSAVDAGAQVVGQKGMLVNKVVIPGPRPELLNEMIYDLVPQRGIAAKGALVQTVVTAYCP